MKIATVDFGAPDGPESFARSLSTTGFAVVVGHPIEADLIRQVQDEWLAWFATADKFAYLPGPGTQDGYHPLDTSETAVGSDVKDIKE